ncbi:histidine phosphatase family protein [Streptomyces sp. DSM 44918]|uniref:Histidine phosphatase family protein n=1 Tax=Streptomyces millisiae TaxID=3075542 RepID=A0ABU2LKP3_9ACTN|nr:histidine phosphatase family protein [Streptomyces sp. DSM 44918]MDT0317817.1 histidine phosphatase family protein [Streptomyces sp. DSM 44918]
MTPAGVRAAAAVVRVPAGAEVELYSSDLLRTRRTAEEIAAVFGAAKILDRRLREKWWLDRRFVPPPAVGERLEHDEGVPGAETKGACVRRVYAAMDEILARPCEHQIVVTHGGSQNFVVASWIRMPAESVGYASFRAPAGSITTLREDDFFHNRQVVALGDTRHLESLATG